MLPTEFRCLQCNARMSPSDTHVRVPYLRRHWWQFGDERSEYRCPACGTFYVLRTGIGGIVGYLAAGIVAGGAWYAGINGVGALALAGIAVFVVSRHTMRLRRTT